MAHGKKRAFIAGVFTGALFFVLIAAALIYKFGDTLGPRGYPYFTESSARQATLNWARLNPFPPDATSFTITTEGGLFTRAFRVSFFGEPAVIQAWVSACPGIMDKKTISRTAPDGTVTFEIVPGGGAVYAELVYHPLRGTVQIYTYWS
jgi:hypothetical protein